MNQKTPTFEKTRPDRVRKQYKKQEEFTLYGWNSCMSAFKTRPESLLRVFFSRARSAELKDVKAFCGEKKLPYRQLDQESLNKVAAGVHHEGVIMVVKPRLPESAHRLIRGKMSDKGLVVVLDSIDNPHNQGAILRTCAFFCISSGTFFYISICFFAISGCGSYTDQIQANLNKLKSTKSCPGCDLTGVELVGFDLKSANLSGFVNLSKSDLSGADLTGANLTAANLTGASLTGADLTGANLTAANLTAANLTGANLTGADLDGVILTDTQDSMLLNQ